MEKIGVQAVFDDAQFKKGVSDYNAALGQAAQSTTKFAAEAEKAGAAAGKSKSPLAGLSDVLKAVATSAAAMQLARTVLDLGSLGVQAQKAQLAFVAISGGTQQATANLNAMRSATQGTISDLDAMAAANRLMQMGLATNAEELGNLTSMAVRLGTAMGRDANASIEEFALLLANQSIPRLDTFGISAGQVRTRIAELQAATPGLSREQAFLTAVMEQGTIAMERLGDAGLGQIQNLDKLKASVANLKTNVGEMLAPALLKGAGAMNTAVTAGDQLVQTLGYAIEKYGYFKGGLMVWQEIFGKSTALTEDATVAQHALAAGLAAADQGFRDVGASAAAAIEPVAAEVAATDSLDERLRQLTLTISGPVSAENQKFQQSMSELSAKSLELQGKIAGLAGERYLTDAQRGDLAQWRGELDQVNAKMAETAAAHDEAMQKIVYDMMMARLSVDGLTEAEFELATTVAQQMGLVDSETAQAMRGVNAAITAFNTSGNAQMAAGLITGIADAAAQIPRTVSIDVEWNISQPPDILMPGKGERPVAFAAGGSRIVTRPTLFMAGERGVGPELITAAPLRGPVDNSRTVTVNLGGATINTRTDPAALAQRVARQVGRML